MATRSLIGQLEQNGLTYEARYCAVDGYPSNQLAQIGEAFRKFYAADPTQFVVDILAHHWWLLSPLESSTEKATGEVCDPSRPPNVEPYAGIGFYFTDFGQPKPSRGTLDEQPGTMIAWLYLFTHDGMLRVFRHEHDPGRWAFFADYTFDDLASLDFIEIAQQTEHTSAPNDAAPTAEASPAVVPSDLRGCMEDGYTPEKVNSVLGQLSDLSGHRLVCVWDYWDDCGFGGNSDFYIEDTDGRTLRYAAGDLWAWLNRPINDPNSPQTPGDPASWVGAVVTDFTINDTSGGDDFHNYALRNDE